MRRRELTKAAEAKKKTGEWPERNWKTVPPQPVPKPALRPERKIRNIEAHEKILKSGLPRMGIQFTSFKDEYLKTAGMKRAMVTTAISDSIPQLRSVWNYAKKLEAKKWKEGKEPKLKLGSRDVEKLIKAQELADKIHASNREMEALANEIKTERYRKDGTTFFGRLKRSLKNMWTGNTPLPREGFTRFMLRESDVNRVKGKLEAENENRQKLINDFGKFWKENGLTKITETYRRLRLEGEMEVLSNANRKSPPSLSEYREAKRQLREKQLSALREKKDIA